MKTPLIDIEKLDTDQRLKLIEHLWESLSVNPEAIPVSEEQKQELDCRLRRMRSAEGTGIPWEVVRKRIFGRLE